MEKLPLNERVECLQNLLIAVSTGGSGNNSEYLALRIELLDNPEYNHLVPKFVRTCRDLSQFWQFIKFEYPTYMERRNYIWSAFQPIFEFLETKPKSPCASLVSDKLTKVDSIHIQKAWYRALERKSTDPESAITAARSLLESVCKYILDENKIQYEDNYDLPKLYALTAQSLNLSPSQHAEKVFRQILGGCHAVVEGLAAIRNKLGDAHGKGKTHIKPSERHAELAVNLSGSMAVFLIETFEKSEKSC